VSRFDYSSESDIQRIMENAARARFNIIYFQARAAADAYYHSDIEPCAALLCGHLGGTPTYDPLAVAVREAHRHGLQLHAWLNALAGQAAGIEGACQGLVESDSGNPRHILLEHPEWAMTDSAGQRLPCPNSEEYIWLSPGYAGVRTRLAVVAADIARRYHVDGIHLDRIRYPGTRWSYDSASLEAFGADPAAKPEAWDRFRRALVSRMVRETHDSIAAVRRSLVLSAAVWGVYDDPWHWHTLRGADDLFQDPRAWARGGYLDVAVPMTYVRVQPTYCARADWTCLLDDHLRGIQRATGRAVYIGIDASKGADEVVKQIRVARRRGAAGFSIFSYGAADRAGLWSVLASGVFATRAVVPSTRHVRLAATRSTEVVTSARP
jgi:uncharacterized lipoprotein YddW (UPF0748 family)